MVPLRKIGGGSKGTRHPNKEKSVTGTVTTCMSGYLIKKKKKNLTVLKEMGKTRQILWITEASHTDTKSSR